jgi:hypothetical protein
MNAGSVALRLDYSVLADDYYDAEIHKVTGGCTEVSRAVVEKAGRLVRAEETIPWRSRTDNVLSNRVRCTVSC